MHTSIQIRFAFALLLMCGVVRAEPNVFGPAERVETIDGVIFAGRLLEKRANGDWVFAHAGQGGLPGNSDRKIVSSSELFRAGAWKPLQSGPHCELRDGGIVRGEPIAWTKDFLELESIDGFDSVRIPHAAIATLVCDPHGLARLRRESPESVAAPQPDAANAGAARVVYANGDARSASIVDLRDGKFLVRSGERESALPFASLTAIVFPQATQPAADAKNVAWLGFADGSRVPVVEIKKANDRWTIVAMSGAKLVAEADALVAIQPLGGKTTYLSDLQPSGFKGIPWLTLEPRWRADLNEAGGPLIIAGERAIKGLGMRSAARITFDLDGKYSTFAARVGIDERAGRKGNAIAKIYGDDGSGEWKPLHETAALRGGAAALPVRVSVKGLKRLSLLVDFGPDDDVGDDVDWLDARLIAE